MGPVMTKELPAPNAVIHHPAEQLVKCGCSKSKYDNVRSSCRKAGLNCTKLCALELGEVCDNPERAISSLNDVEGEDPGDDEDDVENFI